MTSLPFSILQAIYLGHLFFTCRDFLRKKNRITWSWAFCFLNRDFLNVVSSYPLSVISIWDSNNMSSEHFQCFRASIYFLSPHNVWWAHLRVHSFFTIITQYKFPVSYENKDNDQTYKQVIKYIQFECLKFQNNLRYLCIILHEYLLFVLAFYLIWIRLDKSLLSFLIICKTIFKLIKKIHFRYIIWYTVLEWFRNVARYFIFVWKKKIIQ